MQLIIKNFGEHFVCKSNFNISKITVSEFTDTFLMELQCFKEK